jgi:hypothetical protein
VLLPRGQRSDWRRDQAAIALERLTKEWLLGDSFSSRIERRKFQFFERLRPPGGHTKPHRIGTSLRSPFCPTMVSMAVVGQTL